MKKYTRLLSLLLLTALICLSFSSCIKGDRAKGTVENFLKAAAAGDYETAKTHLHPKYPVDVKAYFERASLDEQLDFSKGIEVIRYTEVESSHYDSQVKGSKYETTAKVKVGDVMAEIDVTIVENDDGYGIWEIEIDRD